VSFGDVACTSIPTFAGGAAIEDIDADGDLDIVYARLEAPTQLFLNDGTGQFADAADSWQLSALSSASGVALGDLDGDGDLDLVATHVWDGIASVWIQENGRFTDESGARLPMPSWSTDMCLGFMS